MKSTLRHSLTPLLKLVRLFAHADAGKEQQLFGFGQFVLLLCLAPFIFSLTLFSITDQHSSPSQYISDTERFIPLSYPTSIVIPGHSPGMEYVEDAKYCRGFIEEMLRQPCSKYRDQLQLYQQQAETLMADPVVKPEMPDLKISEHAEFSFNALLQQAAQLSALQLISAPFSVLAIVLLIPCLWLSVRKKQWGLLVFALLVPSLNYALTLLAWLFPAINWYAWQLSSPVFAQLAFIWFVIHGHIRSRAFVLFILLMITSTLIPLLLSHHLLTTYHYTAEDSFSLLRAQFPIMIFMLITAIGRLFVIGARENWQLLKQLGILQTLRSSLHALLLWLPMLLIALPMLFLTEILLPDVAIQQLHQDKILRYDQQHDLLDNVLQSVAVKADDAQFAWYLALERAKIDIRAKKKQLDQLKLSSYVSQTFRQLVPEKLSFSETKTGVPLVGSLLDYGITKTQQSTNAAFQRHHQQLEKRLTDFVAVQEDAFKKAVLDPSAKKSLEIIDTLYTNGKSAIQVESHHIQASLWWTINTSRAIHQFAVLLFLLICIKSYLYVFARVSFHRTNNAVVSLGKTSQPAPLEQQACSIQGCGHQYRLSSENKETFYISRRFQCRGKAPRFALPQAYSAFFSRLFSNNLTMNKIVIEPGDATVSLTATQGLQFYEWQLAAGETVIFRFANFVGISQGVTISTLISPRISSLLLGGIVFSQACGPGKLILMAKGNAEISQAGDGSLPPQRLIAMHTDTSFHVESELDLLNVYLSSAYVSPADGQQLVDVDTQRGARSGLTTFIRQFIVPL